MCHIVSMELCCVSGTFFQPTFWLNVIYLMFSHLIHCATLFQVVPRGAEVHHNITPQELCNNWLYSAHQNSFSVLHHSTV